MSWKVAVQMLYLSENRRYKQKPSNTSLPIADHQPPDKWDGVLKDGLEVAIIHSQPGYQASILKHLTTMVIFFILKIKDIIYPSVFKKYD